MSSGVSRRSCAANGRRASGWCNRDWRRATRWARALKRLPADVTGALTAKLQESVVSAFAEFVKGQSQQFTTAAEDTADGITLTFTIVQPAGLEHIGKALLPGGSTAGVADAIRAAASRTSVSTSIPGTSVTEPLTAVRVAARAPGESLGDGGCPSRPG